MYDYTHVRAHGCACRDKWIYYYKYQEHQEKKTDKFADKVMYSQLPKIYIKSVNYYSNDDLTTPSILIMK